MSLTQRVEATDSAAPATLANDGCLGDEGFQLVVE